MDHPRPTAVVGGNIGWGATNRGGGDSARVEPATRPREVPRERRQAPVRSQHWVFHLFNVLCVLEREPGHVRGCAIYYPPHVEQSTVVIIVCCVRRTVVSNWEKINKTVDHLRKA